MSQESKHFPRFSENCVPTSDRAAYLDSSAIVKLVIQERETEAVRAFLRPYSYLTSSVLSRVEVIRAVRIYGSTAASRADIVLRSLSIMRLTDEIAAVAGSVDPGSLKSLDAIHLATAFRLGSALAVLVTYDVRMITAAQQAGIPVSSPS
jgi:predicted nucleic acid-binding protein